MVFNINADFGWILVPAWLHFGAVWAPKTRLGSVLGRLGSILGRQISPSMVFTSTFHGLGLRFRPWELQKSLIFHWFFNVFLVFVVFDINADFGWILVPTGLHFGTAWAPKTHLGSVLGHLGGVLGACWGVLGASWSFLGASWACLGASWARLGPSWRRLGTSWARLGSILEAF